MYPKRDIIWYLNLYTLCHFNTNKNLFIKKLQPIKYLDFTIVSGQTLYLKNIGTIVIFFTNGASIKLNNIAYAQNYDFNLSFFGQLLKNGITNVNNIETMTLI